MRATLRVLSLIDVVVFGLLLWALISISLSAHRVGERADLDALGRSLSALGGILLIALPLALVCYSMAISLAKRAGEKRWLSALLIALGAAICGTLLLFVPPISRLALLVSEAAFGPGVSPGSSLGVAWFVGLGALAVVPLAYSITTTADAASNPLAATPEQEANKRRLQRGAAITSLALGALLNGLLVMRPLRQPSLVVLAAAAGVIGMGIALVLGVALIARAFRHRQWAWSVGLLAFELATVWLNLLLYVPFQAVDYPPLDSIFRALYGMVPNYADGPYLDSPLFFGYVLPLAAPVALPLVLLAYVWWDGRRGAPSSIAAPAAS